MADRLIKNTYRIEREIGAGGMGAVYEATHVDLGKCALKQLKQQFAGRADVLKRFRREARDMFRLKHPHIVRVFDYGVEEGFGAYLVMDFVDGSDLGRIIRENGPLPLDEIIRIGSEVASALDYAHAQGLVHRDIKPGNILIERTTKRALVTDFGIAKHTEQKEDETTDAMTHTEGFIGTSRYSSPEQLRSEDLDARADIYSLGAVLYEMTSGRKFLEGMPENQIIIRVGGFSDWKPDLPYPDGVPPALVDLIEACIERDRDKRIARAAEIIERLRHCAQVSSVAAPASAPSPAARPAPRAIPEEPTQPTAIERFETLRANLRRDADAALDRIDALDAAAQRIGIDAPSQVAPALRIRLEEVRRLEEDGAYERAVRALEEIAEHATREHDAIAQRLRTAIDSARTELDDSWREMLGRARGFVGQTHSDRFEQLLAFIVERLREQDWHHAAIGLTEARQVRADAEADARQRAEQAIATAARTIEEKARQLEAVNALPPEFDRAALQRRIRATLDAGNYTQARADAESALALLDAAIAAWQRREQDAATAARQEIAHLLDRLGELHHEIATLDPTAVADLDLEQARLNVRNLLEASRPADAQQLAAEILRQLTETRDAIHQRDRQAALAARQSVHAAASATDLEAAAVVDSDALEAATTARNRAEEAWERGDHRTAASAYDMARRAYQAVAERVESARVAALEELRSATEQARTHPEAVVGDVLRAANDLLTSNPSLLAIQGALAEIRAAVEQVAPYRTALEHQQACADAESALRKRPQTVLSSRTLRRPMKKAEALLRSASDSFAHRQWTESAERYRAATTALIEVNQQALRIEQQPPRSTSRIALATAVPALIALVILALWTVRPPVTEERLAPKPPAPEARKPDADTAPPVVLAKAEPADDQIVVAEGASQRFAVTIEGGPPGTTAKTQWWLDARKVAENTFEWTYDPGYDAARAEPRVVRVRAGDGDDAPVKEWRVTVTDVNRPPVISKTEPAAGKIEQEIGQTARFHAEARDPDDDPLRYSWTVDGKPAGEGPELAWKVAADHRISLAITDGKAEDPVTTSWELAAIAPVLPPLTLKTDPPSLSSLRFRTAQEFRLQPPPDAKGLQYEWRLDGKRVGSSPVYVFANDDPALVRTRPVEVAVTVTDERNRKLSKSWTFKVQPPPAPRIAGSAPASPVELDATATVDLRLEPAPAVEGQAVTYAFSVDGGQEERSTTPSFRFAPRKAEHVVVARAVDNFGQSSERVTWRIRRKETAVAAIQPETLPAAAPADGAVAVQNWLETYREAFVRKDISALKSMMKLSGDKVEVLRKQLAMQNDLRVAFSNVKIEALGDGRYRATYERQDFFTNAQTGRPVSPAPVQVRQEFRVVEGRAELER